MMMKVQIWVIDDSKAEQMENLGIDAKVDTAQLVDFYFRKSELSCFWVDIAENEETGTIDIFFSIGSVSYRTPYTEQKANMFYKILEND